jgi:hypothetical protein
LRGPRDLGTRARPAVHAPLLAARLLFALVLGLLVPLPGTIVILAGEGFLTLRLLLRDRDTAPARDSDADWAAAFRQAAAKWGFAASMIAFTWTLRDSIAEIGGALSFLLWIALNFWPWRLQTTA